MWGKAYQAHDELGLNELRFAGQQYDAESGLCYNRFRYYHPDSGCYLSPDPLGLLGGLNTHAYVPNPTGWVDPLGLAGCGTLKRGDINANISGGVPKGYAGHHLIGVAEANRFPVMHKAAGLGYNINRGANGIALPRTIAESKKTGLPLHSGRHISEYENLVNTQLNKLQKKYDLGKVNDEKLISEIGKIEGNIRGRLLSGKTRLQHIDPN